MNITDVIEKLVIDISTSTGCTVFWGEEEMPEALKEITDDEKA